MEKENERFKYVAVDGPLVDISQSRCPLSES